MALALLLGPFGLGADSDALGDAVDVVEVGDHLDRVVDGGVIPAVRAQLVRVRRRDRRRLAGELDRVVAESANRAGQVGLPVVVRRVRRELLICALSTEVVCMRAYSVVAVVLARDDDREQLALLPREPGRPEHDRLVELHRGLEHARPQAHRLDDVEDLAGPADRRVVLLLQRAGRVLDLDQAHVRHPAILAQDPWVGARRRGSAGPRARLTRVLRLAPEVDGVRDESARRDAAEDVLARLPGPGEDDQQLLNACRREAAVAVHGQLGPAVGPGGLLGGGRELVERDGVGVDQRPLDGLALTRHPEAERDRLRRADDDRRADRLTVDEQPVRQRDARDRDRSSTVAPARRGRGGPDDGSRDRR